MKIFRGNVVFCKEIGEITILENGYIVVKDGLVVKTCLELPTEYQGMEVTDFGNKMIIPGFVDLHFHAPQFENLGLGLDYELLPWLEKYTFVEEAKFANKEYATDVYSRVVQNIWRNGTTRIVFFSTLHKEGTKILLDLLGKSGLGGYVGKVNMNRNAPEYLIENGADSLKDTEEILKEYQNKYELVKPIITPRFVPSCDSELLNGLGELACKYNTPMQTHLSENMGEIMWVKDLHPDSTNYLDVYKKSGIIGESTIFAHSIYCDEDEVSLLKESNSFVAHCPNANFNLSSGIMPLRAYLEKGVNVGLGSDVGAGHQTSIKDVMVSAIFSSKLKWLETNKELIAINVKEALYLATKGGGKFFGKVGSFEDGYEFDALVIDDSTLGITEGRTVMERLEKYIYIGDDRNIATRFVKGQEVLEPKA